MLPFLSCGHLPIMQVNSCLDEDARRLRRERFSLFVWIAGLHMTSDKRERMLCFFRNAEQFPMLPGQAYPRGILCRGRWTQFLVDNSQVTSMRVRVKGQDLNEREHHGKRPDFVYGLSFIWF